MIPLTTPFVYDPSQGDLLLDIFMRNSPVTRAFDTSIQGQQAVTRRITAQDVTAASGAIDSSFAGLVTRFDMQPDEDWYSFSATSGIRLRVETSTPADGTREFANGLNPLIELYNPSNVRVATGVALADGRNEFIQITPSVSGTYRLRVIGESGTSGEYFVTRDSTGPRVIATSVVPGATQSPGELVIHTTFSEPMLASNLSSGDYSLRGNLLGVNYNTAGVFFNEDGTVLTHVYEDLPDDNYTFTLVAGSNGGTNFTNIGGNALDGEFSSTFPSGNGTAGGNFILNFNMQPASEAYPFAAEPPLGSLIYDPTLRRAIVPAGDSDTFTFRVDTGQTIAVLVTPNSPSPLLWPTVELFDPNNNLLRSATAAAAGQIALIQAVTATSAATGDYRVVVSGSAATTGQYKVQVLLNAALESPGAGPLGSNKSREAAQNLDAAFIGLETNLNAASRAAVAGNVGQTALSAIDAGWWDNAGSHTATNKNYVAGQESATTTFRNFFVFDLATVTETIAGARLEIFNPAGGYNGDTTETYSVFDITTPLATLRASGSGQTGIFADLGTGANFGEQVFEESNENSVKPVPLNVSGVNFLNASRGTTIAVGGAVTTISGTASQNVFSGSGPVGLLSDTRQLVLTVAQDSDFYSVTLTDGQAISVALENVAEGGATLALQDAAGNVVATGEGGATNLDLAIRNYVAAGGGVYYVVVASVQTDARYNLVVTRDAAFDTERNDTFGAAQPLGGARAGDWGSGDRDRHRAVASGRPRGNSANGFPFNLQIDPVASMRYQQIYDRAEFSRPGQITAIRFRRNTDVPFTSSGLDVKINLSHAATSVATVSPTFAENIGAGETTVYDSDVDGLLTLSSSAIEEVNPFDIVIPLTTPFFYDPSQGDLLLDVSMRNSSLTAQFDFSSSGQQTTTRRVYATDVEATLGRLDLSTGGYAGLVTRFDIAPSEDWYTVEVSSTVGTLHLATSTPFDGPGHVINTLNPRIELYSPAGALVATGSEGADGRNESIDFHTVVAGTYRCAFRRAGAPRANISSRGDIAQPGDCHGERCGQRRSRRGGNDQRAGQ